MAVIYYIFLIRNSDKKIRDMFELLSLIFEFTRLFKYEVFFSFDGKYYSFVISRILIYHGSSKRELTVV